MDAVIKQLETYQFVVTDAEIVNSELQVLFPSHFAHTAVKKGFFSKFFEDKVHWCMHGI